ncbi:helix-turn-helix domain-containing protein [Paracidovorax citrulli]|nr:transcriptional regulator [Paracidovorax citrulli]UMT86412.1 helix-turn-helix domain-containing protein [Paracidovorax citrulli]
MKRDVQGLREAGEALFGGTWQTALAEALGLSDARRVREWLAGTRRIPPGIWDDIKRLLEERSARAQAMAGGLDDAGAPQGG